MRQVALRVITGGRLRGALAAFEVERLADAVILSVPVGAPGFRRTGPRGGPRGSFLLPGSWDQGMKPQPWHGLDVVMVHRFADPWSTWRWLDDDRQWTPGFYVNIERRWVVGESTYDTDDLTLDVVVSGDGGVTLKDEHELDWAEREGIYTSTEAADIRAHGDVAVNHFRSAGWPLRADWERWRTPATGQVQPYRTIGITSPEPSEQTAPATSNARAETQPKREPRQCSRVAPYPLSDGLLVLLG